MGDMVGSPPEIPLPADAPEPEPNEGEATGPAPAPPPGAMFILPSISCMRCSCAQHVNGVRLERAQDTRNNTQVKALERRRRQE